MALVLVSTNPINDATDISLTSSVEIVIESNIVSPSIILSTLNVSITRSTLSGSQTSSVIVSGAPQPGYIVSVIIDPLPGPGSRERLTINFQQATPFNSFEIVGVSFSVQDTNSTLTSSISFQTLDVIAPVFTNLTPAPNSLDNSTNTPIFIKIEDEGAGINLNSVLLTVDVITEEGITATNAIIGGILQSGFQEKSILQQIGSDVDILLIKDGISEYPSGAEIKIDISASDDQNLSTESYFFKIIDIEPPVISNLFPSPDSININEDTTITLAYSDPNGDGINNSSINVIINGDYAIRNGIPQLTFGTTVFTQTGTALITVISPNYPLPSAFRTIVYTSVSDIRGNFSELEYQFIVRDYRAPRILDFLPPDQSENILPDTDICFILMDDPRGFSSDGYDGLDGYYNGYGIDFSSLQISVDGYSVYDGYFTGAGEYIQSTEEDGYGNVTFRGYKTTIKEKETNKYKVIIDPLVDFDFSTLVSITISVADKGSHQTNFVSSFTTAPQGAIMTTAIPDTGTYKNFLDGYGLVEGSQFLFQNGIVFEVNLSDTITYYTLDGSMPSIDKYGMIKGNTRMFDGRPIKLQREGLHVLKYFSADQAGNKEEVKQEIYMIKPTPPQIRQVRYIRIVQDLSIEVTIIPVENTLLFKEGQIVKVLDDLRPPVFTKVLSVNSSSNPPFLIVKEPVQRLKMSRNARVELIDDQIDPASTIEFDTTSVLGNIYIGSNGYQHEQADAVLEEFRILNKSSTDEEILADFTLLTKGSRFFNSDSPIELSNLFTNLEKERVNLPDNTLILLGFDGSIQNAERQGVLKSNTVPIVDTAIASNVAIFKIQIKRGSFVDRELLKRVLRNFAPVDLDVRVEFEEID